MSIDVSQFHATFFEESLEGLDVMENGLLQIKSDVPTDAELINTIFRAAHSIKGGSGTFGFMAISDFTHILETLLDEVREGRRVLDNHSVELLLKSCDCLRNMILAAQNGDNIEDIDTSSLVTGFRELLGEPGAAESAPKMEKTDQESDIALKKWKISFQPEPRILLSGNEPSRLFRELKTLGQFQVSANTTRIPDFDQLTPDECFIDWTLHLTGDCTREEIEEIFEWVIDECQLVIEEESESRDLPCIDDIATPESDGSNTRTVADNPTPSANSNKTPPGTNTSIRVGIDKVDSLINLVGELVITQSMLSELGNNFDMSKLDRLSNGLEQLLQNTRELQESVMQIRMLPISYAFNRFPRMIRDLSSRTGKKIELHLSGENTELDKTVMEQISDPLTHLVRNAADHGVETPQERLAKGKPETGMIQLNAYHKGGNIVVEICDDGKGMDPARILEKAREKGLVTGEQVLSDQETFELIFEPGFSTADSVSDISGRGVGMDVVRRNINSLGGRIEIESEQGKGSTFRVHLPLTLAILDGQLVRVGAEVYIIPLISIVESLQIKMQQVNKVAGGMLLYRLREDNVPILPLYSEFGIDPDNRELDNGLLVVVEGEGQKIGLLVDDLLAQQQVVIKSLESNYHKVQGISGATILGDGSVSMILDIPGMVRRAFDQRNKNTVGNHQPRAA